MALKEIIDHFKQEGQVIKGSPFAFATCVLVLAGFIFAGVAWHYEGMLAQKDATIAQKDARIGTISEQRDGANRENDKLLKQVEELRIYRGKDTLPIKTKALILARQIHDFTKDWKDTDPDQYQNVQKYLQRFGLRASIVRDDLDQSGQQSDALDKVMYNFNFRYGDVRTIAAEIEKLADNLPD